MSQEYIEAKLVRWIYAQKRRGKKVSRSKTEYLCGNEKVNGETVRLQVVEVAKADEFKYGVDHIQ